MLGRRKTGPDLKNINRLTGDERENLDKVSRENDLYDREGETWKAVLEAAKEIDPHKLTELAKEYLQPLGVQPHEVKLAELIPPRKEGFRHKGAQGGYYGTFHKISISEFLTTAISGETEYVFPSREKQRRLFVGVIFHEEVHALGRHSVTQTGYTNEFDSWRVFNEGMTDIMAEELFDLYQDRYGFGMQNTTLSKIDYPKSYHIGRGIVFALAKRISQECGVSEQMAMRGLKASYFQQGFRGWDRESWSTFVETISPDALNRLRQGELTKFNSTASAFSGMIHLVAQNWSTDLKQRWRKVLGLQTEGHK